MARTLPKYSFVYCRDPEERFLRKDYSKGVTLSRPLGHFCKKKNFSGFRLKSSKKLSKVERLEKKFILIYYKKFFFLQKWPWQGHTLRIVFSQKSFFQISAIDQGIFGQSFGHFACFLWVIQEWTSERANELKRKINTSA